MNRISRAAFALSFVLLPACSACSGNNTEAPPNSGVYDSSVDGPNADASVADSPPDISVPDSTSLDSGVASDPLGAVVVDGGVQFRVWAPHATAVSVVCEAPVAKSLPLTKEDGGTFAGWVDGIGPGESYRYVIESDGQSYSRVDPRGRELSGKTAKVVDPSAYTWKLKSFIPPAREDMVLYELHVFGYAGQDDKNRGLFAGVVDRLDHLKSLGVNAIELMPVNSFGGSKSWGYNPQAYFAPNASFGSPDDLRRLVDEAHARGIAVLVDVVYNHYDGWKGAPLYCFDGYCPSNSGIYFFPEAPYASTPWGPRPDFSSNEVSTFLLDSVRTWLTEYNVDGFRWDSTSNIRGIDGQGTVPGGRSFLERGNLAVHQTKPGAISIAEDLKGFAELTKPLTEGGFGFDAQWDGFGYVVREQITKSVVADRSVVAVRDSIVGSYNGDPFQRLLFTENHDVSGNESTRLPNLIDSKDPGSFAARKESMLAAGVMLTTPGVPMLFMGQEFLERGKFTDPPPALDWSKVDSYGPVLGFYRDMIRLRRNLDGFSPGLKTSKVDVYHVNDSVKVIAYKRWDKGNDEVIVVANFGSAKYTRYDVGLPSGGTWHVRVNSDDKKYSTDFDGLPSDDITALALPLHGMSHTGPIALGRYSIVVLSK